MRIATWNLERTTPRSWKKLPAQLRQLAEVNADIWVLTETHPEVQPGPGYHGAWLPGTPTQPGESYVSIWSRWPVEIAGDTDPRGSLPVLIDHPDGPLLVHGLVIPYHADTGPAGDKKFWQRHFEWLEMLPTWWSKLRADQPGVDFVAAGDFNEAFDPAGYGTKKGLRLLEQALSSAELQCPTSRLHQDGMALIDHIAVPKSWSVVSTTTWSRRNRQAVRMSDHAGVVVHLGI